MRLPANYTGPTNEQLRAAESQALDSLNSIGMAIAHKVVLGMNVQCITSEDGKIVSPALTLFVPGEPPTVPGLDPGPIRQLRLTVPQDGQNFLGLIVSAADFCHGMLCKAQESGDVNCTDYFASKQEIDKVRKENRPRIILPGAAGKN